MAALRAALVKYGDGRINTFVAVTTDISLQTSGFKLLVRKAQTVFSPIEAWQM